MPEHQVTRPNASSGDAYDMSFATILKRAIVSGTAATGTSTAALALVAIIEGKNPLQPVNATSHWLYGDRAARVRGPTLDFTTIGFATHFAATIFWAFSFETTLALRPTRQPAAIVGRAAAIGTMAAIVDYTITPKRFTPGWELVLSKLSMGLVFGAMAAGFAAAAIRAERTR